MKIDKLNVGAGPWTLSGWATLDNPCSHYTWPAPPTIALDLTTEAPVPLESGSLRLAFTSHLVEHLFDDQARRLFREVRRLLRPGGVFRVVCPDVGYYIHEYRMGRLTAKQFMVSFAAGLQEEYDEEWASGMIQGVGPKSAAKAFAWSNPRDTNKRHPERHVNWFDGPKLVGMLCDAGFAGAREAARGDSVSAEMRDLEHFDCSHHYMSLYAEAVR